MGLFDNARTPHEHRLQTAAKTGDVADMEVGLQEWRNDSSISPPKASDLHLAAGIAISSNQSKALKYLLDQGSSVDNTLARQAAGKEGNNEQLHWLLNHGASPNVPCGRTNDTPLSRAARMNLMEPIDLLLQHGAELKASNALHAAASGGGPDDESLATMQRLIELGADVNAIEAMHVKRSGHNIGIHGTALHGAIRASKPLRVRWLLEHGADGTIRNEGGYSPLEWAKECRSSKELVAMLKKAGCE
ncbi:hypothetical protein LTR01_007538 [Friedmanniomyces endolithicus]|nr:hypothetical protein LTS09_014465 [Friedmanniomyces endolithicus]KAK0304182.1 hypothetical protein LTR01_007538 [Friedmanniomyces endolithicus]KAK0824747.1 hypothetical protein LTR73_007552 [Friedmanniomyces endolithicus]